MGGTAAHASGVDVTSVVDVTAPTGSVTLAPGADGAITINLSVTGKQEGTATFSVNRDWTLNGGVFTGSNPETFTVYPRGAQDAANTFTASGTVSVAAAQAAGSFTLTVGVNNDITNDNKTGAKLAAGGSATYSVTVTSPPPPPADTTAPVITYTLSPASPDGLNGWYRSDVLLDWTVSDPESDIDSSSGCDDLTIGADQAATTYTCTATSAGGTSSETTVAIKRDATAPGIAWTGGPAGGASYYFGSVPAAPTCEATDSLSGAGACTVTGWAATVGSHTLKATAFDLAGNKTVESRTYTVLAWTLRGFHQPVDMGSGVWNTVKGGSTVPLKFEVFAGETELTDTAVVDAFTVQGVSCPASDATTDDIELTTSGGTSLRYDATGGQFVQNWQTPKKPGACYKVTMKTDDGSSISANFKLK